MPGLIVHEWIDKFGGSENVLAAMASTFPDAEIACLWNNDPGRFADHVVRESWLARTPLRRSKAFALPFMPTTWARTDVSGKDFVLVSSHLFAHHVGGRMPAGGPTKFVYVHTPARYIWAPEFDERGRNLFARALSPALRRLDASKAGQGATFAANSEFIRGRISETWHRESTVIYPPVDVERLQSVVSWREKLSDGEKRILSSLPSKFLLGASRFVAYKKLEVVVLAGKVAGLPVVLAGDGPQRAELISIGKRYSVPVHIVHRPSDELLYALYQAADVFVFPSVEDFGIMPVEAMALGTPTIVNRIGGASESVTALRGGAIVDSLSTSSIEAALEIALRLDMGGAQRLAKPLFGGATFSRKLASLISGVGDPAVE